MPALFLGAAVHMHSSSAKNATLTLLPFANSRARCLDGSNAGYYIRETHPGDSWVVAIDGGGWCYNESSCYDRSLTDLGSSSQWPASRPGGDITSDDCNSNPTFCKFNLALIPYCDGFSQLGSRTDPIVYANASFRTNLWARGLDNLQETLEHLLAHTSFKQAPSVLVTGCSAGGLSTYLHTDRIAAVLPPTTKVAGIGDAGFFVDAPTITNDYYFRSLLTYYYPMHNGSAGVNPACLAARPATLGWQCATAPVSISYLSHPVFLVQSNFDTYQLGNIFAPAWLPGIDSSWWQCAGNPSKCSALQLVYTWLPEFRGQLAAAGVLGPGPATAHGPHGLFLHSCMVHCQLGMMHTWKVNGSTMYAALSGWWSGSASQTQWVDPPCLSCNPTCSYDAADMP
jgi:O-palmitoleoyl-L-serine hydrolase